MPTPTQSRLRIAADLSNYIDFTDSLHADTSGYIPKFRAGDDLQVEVALFEDGTLLDISSVTSLTLEVKPIEIDIPEAFDQDEESGVDLRGPNYDTGLLLSKTVSVVDMVPALTQSDWDSDAPDKVHVLFSLTAEETRLTPGDRWLTVSMLTGDSPAVSRTICAGRIRILGGGQSHEAPIATSVSESFYNSDESDARFLKVTQNLSDLPSPSSARTNLELGTAATIDIGGSQGEITVSDGTLDVTTASGIVVNTQDAELGNSGKTLPGGALVGNTDEQALANKDISDASNTYRVATSTLAGAVVIGDDPADVPTNADLDSLWNSKAGLRGLAFDGSLGHVTVPYYDFGDSDFTLAALVKFNDISTNQSIFIYGWTGAGQKWTALTYSAGIGLRFFADDDSALVATNGAQITANVWYYVVGVRDASVLRLYVNGVEVDNADASTLGAVSNSNMDSYLGAYLLNGTGINNHLDGMIAYATSFNTGLSASEVSEFCANGPDQFLAMFSGYAGAYLTATSGALETGRRYRISAYVSGDDFTNLGASSNATGIEFTATGMAPAGWSNGSAIERICAIANYQLDGDGRIVKDSTDNQNDGICSSGGAAWSHQNPFIISPVTIANGTGSGTNTNILSGDFQPAGTIIVGIAFVLTSGSGNFTIGTSSGGTQIVGSTGGASGYLDASGLNSANYQASSDDLYINMGANTTYELTFNFQRI